MSGAPAENRDPDTSVPDPTRSGRTAQKASFVRIYHLGQH